MKVDLKVTGVESVNAALQRFADAVGKDSGPLIAEEARLFWQDVMKFTPPKTLAEGRNAVDKEIRRAFPDFTVNARTSSRVLDAYEYATRTGDIGPLNHRFEKAGNVRRAVKFDKALHKKSRNSSGRVVFPRIQQMIATEQDRAARERYILETQKKSGMVKGAIGKIILHVNSLVRFKANVPAWIARNADAGSRWLSTAFSASLDKGKPFVRAGVGVHPEAKKAVGRALRNREKAINKKVRALVSGKAAIIKGRFTILERIK